ncbi:hypothetical protein JCM8202_003527 [Rhodotorula sphaerocarpa]
MNKIKQVFSHDEQKNERAPPTGSNAGDRTTSRQAETAAEDRPVAETKPTSDTGIVSKEEVRETPDEVEYKAEAKEVPTEGAHVKERAEPPAHHHAHPTEDALLDPKDAKEAEHDHQHLAPVTHERHQVHEVEEVERERDIDRNIHHVQHHVQPVLDERHGEEKVQQKEIPTTEIREGHAATEEDKAQFAALNTAHDEREEAGREKVIVDKGEKVKEHDHHHVHHVVQPVIEKDVHEHNRIKTEIPIHQQVDEAPIVHQSVQHEPLKLDEFKQGGGVLDSTLKHDGSLLERGECERTVDGPAETMAQTYGLSQAGASSNTPART